MKKQQSKGIHNSHLNKHLPSITIYTHKGGDFL